MTHRNDAESPELSAAEPGGGASAGHPARRGWSRLGAIAATASLAAGLMVAVATPAAAAVGCADIVDGLRLTRATTVSGCSLTFSSNTTIDLNGYSLSIVATPVPVRVTAGTLRVVGGGQLTILGGTGSAPFAGLRVDFDAEAVIDADTTVVGGGSRNGGPGVVVKSGGKLSVTGGLNATGRQGANGANGADGAGAAGSPGAAGGRGGSGIEVDGSLRVEGRLRAVGGKGGNGGKGGDGAPGFNGGAGGDSGTGGAGVIIGGTVFASVSIDANQAAPASPGQGGAAGGPSASPGANGADVPATRNSLNSTRAVLMTRVLGYTPFAGIYGYVNFRAERAEVTPPGYFAYGGTVGAMIAALPAGWPGTTGFLGWFREDGTAAVLTDVTTSALTLYAHWAEEGDPGTPGTPGDPGTPGTVCATYAPLPDVSASNPHCADIAWLTDVGVVWSTAAAYRPDAAMTRGKLVTFLFKVTTSRTPKPRCTVKPFKDVKKKSKVCGYVKWAKDKGIVTGKTSSKFKPAAAVTRGAAAVYLYRTMHSGKSAPACKTKPFKDVAKKSAQCGAIKWMKKTGIDTGITARKYQPGKVLTRGAAATMLHALSRHLA